MSRPRHVNAINLLRDYAMLVVNERSFVFDTYFLPHVQEHHWYIGRGGRLCTHVGSKRKTLYLARHITKARKNQRVSHIDGDVTNLRAENLCVKTLARKKPRV